MTQSTSEQQDGDPGRKLPDVSYQGDSLANTDETAVDIARENALVANARDGKFALGSAPTMQVLDERGLWGPPSDELEAALLSGLGKPDDQDGIEGK